MLSIWLGKTIPADALSCVNGNEISVIDTSERANLDSPESTPIGGDPDMIDVSTNEPSSEVESCIDWQNLNVREEQQKDPKIEGLITLLSDGALLPDFVLEDNLLYHIVPSVKGENSPSLQLVIPRQLSQSVVDELIVLVM